MHSSSKVFSATKALVLVAAVLAISTTSDAAGVPTCDQECGDHGSPICGSDGVTYLNACHFDRAFCKDKELIPMGYGPCER